MRTGVLKNLGGVPFVPVVHVSLREIGLRKRKQINVRQRLKYQRRLGQIIFNQEGLSDGMVP